MASDPVHAVVVDPRADAYDALRESLGGALQLSVLGSGRAALESTTGQSVDGWIINVHLPDMSGFELYEILHQRHPSCRFVLVGDTYRADDERQARACGGSYLCKPPQVWWLEQFQSSEK